MKSTVLTLFIIPFLLVTTFQTPDSTNFGTNPVVLELFTSQGCSSCPPADRLLKDVKSDKVITLSYHVDYWNYIGWKDPFSNEEFTRKQRRYGNKFYSSTIYTPQLVVNGREHFVGSDKRKLQQKIKQYSTKKSESHISILKASTNDTKVDFDYVIEDLKPNDNLRIVLVIDERKTSVKRGENRNKVLVNNNIVVAEQKFKLDKSSGSGVILIPKIVEANDNLSLVLILENDTMDITTAAQKSL
ncbi:DUF1223 domain-containing protein [Winogradskyella jejuensis]|uniref:DUF1223 domain-containing protein n=1 Tax=Winogradskyella jejuensis TaxID=1089305 RepID=A0A1M5TSN2_9FLAO|nr:DUF1223 domain-containing protein [Winogradskyella jejuensis]SHH53678.1 Protein of unknown function [Winogradskyella jejuensis]